jgi:hypothetical protein
LRLKVKEMLKLTRRRSIVASLVAVSVTAGSLLGLESRSSGHEATREPTFCLDPALDASLRDAIRSSITNAALVDDERCLQEPLISRTGYDPRQPPTNSGVTRMFAEDGDEFPETFIAVRALPPIPEDSAAREFLPFTDYVIDAAYYCSGDVCLGVGWEVYVVPGEETSEVIRRVTDALDDSPPDVIVDSPDGQPPVSRPERPPY